MSKVGAGWGGAKGEGDHLHHRSGQRQGEVKSAGGFPISLGDMATLTMRQVEHGDERNLGHP